MKVIKKILKTVLILLTVCAAIIGIIISVIAPDNVKAMNKSVNTFCDIVGKYYPLKEADCGKYKNLKLFGIIKFNIKQYEVEGIGNLAVMTTNMGLMQMATVVLTPTKRDIPLTSMDYMCILGNRKVYVEFYDLVLSKDDGYAELIRKLKEVRDQYPDLETVTPKAAWHDALSEVGFYKKGSKADDDTFIDMMKNGVDLVLNYARTLPELDADAQAKKAALQKEYSNGLIDKGGVSTDTFVKALGKEETRKFFDRVLFKVE